MAAVMNCLQHMMDWYDRIKGVYGLKERGEIRMKFIRDNNSVQLM